MHLNMTDNKITNVSGYISASIFPRKTEAVARLFIFILQKCMLLYASRFEILSHHVNKVRNASANSALNLYGFLTSILNNSLRDREVGGKYLSDIKL
jgi:Zn-dependent M16 (insulinase) family peptidase